MPIEHEAPTHDERAPRVLFELEDTSVGETEALWGEWAGDDAVRLDNIPLLVFGVSMKDTVRVTRSEGQLAFAGVVARGGHSTYRVMLDGGDDPRGQQRLREIVVLGCGLERLTPRFAAIDVPPQVDVFKVHGLLERGLKDRVWAFEEAHCGHPVDSDAG